MTIKRKKKIPICGSIPPYPTHQTATTQLRGGTLNSSGVYNRCKLTRLVVDTDWDRKVWEESWESKKREKAHLDRLVESDMLREEEFNQEEKRKRGQSNCKFKKRKIENESGVVWGEEAVEQDESVALFLYNQHQVPGERKSTKQSTLRPLRGADWDRWEDRREIPIAQALMGSSCCNISHVCISQGWN